MSYTSAHNSRVLIGALQYTAYTTQFSLPTSIAMLDTTTLADASHQYIPSIMSGSGSFALLLDSNGSAGGQFAHATAWQSAAAQPLTYQPQGLTQGFPALMISTLESKYEISATMADKVVAKLDVMGTSHTDHGLVLDGLNTLTVDTNGTSVDNGALTSNGGVAHLHVTAFSGFTSDVVYVEHSTDNSTWATLATFTTVTGTTSERVLIAAGTTVNRYLRVRDDVTGTGSITRTVAFARR